MHGIYQDEKHVLFTSSFDSKLYEKVGSQLKSVTYIQRGGDQIVKKSYDAKSAHLIYGEGMVWDINLKAEHLPDMIDSQILIKDAYDYTHLYENTFMLRDKNGLTVHMNNNIQNVIHKVAYQSDKEDKFLYKKVIQVGQKQT